MKNKKCILIISLFWLIIVITVILINKRTDYYLIGDYWKKDFETYLELKQQKIENYIDLDEKIKKDIVNYINRLKINSDWKNIDKNYKKYFDEDIFIQNKNPNSKITGIMRKIYLKKVDKDLVNEKNDELIYLIYDTNNKLLEKNIKIKK